MSGYHIILIDIVNVKKIKLFRAKVGPEGFIIAGPPDIGKTTIADSIWELLKPSKDLISHGEKNAEIKILIDDGKHRILAKRRHTAKGNTIRITSLSDGEPVSVETFKKMLSPLASNPHLIEKMEGSKKLKLLLQSAGVDPDIYDALNLKEATTAADLSDAKKAKKFSIPGDEPEKVDSVGTEELTKKLSEITEHNKTVEEAKTKWGVAALSLSSAEQKKNEAVYALDSINQQLKSLNVKIEELQKERSNIEANGITHAGIVAKEISNVEEAVAEERKSKESYESMETIPPEKVSEVVKQSTESNAKAQTYADWQERVKLDTAAIARVDAAKLAHDKAIKDRKDIIDGAVFPLDGLTIEDGDLVYNGMLVDNLGTDKKTLVYASLAFEDALQHKLRVVQIDGIESMCPEDYAKIQKIALEKGIQLLATRVTWRSDPEGNEITIEDGHYCNIPNEEE